MLTKQWESLSLLTENNIFPRKHNQEFDYVLTALQSLYDKEHFNNKQALGNWEIVIQRQTALHMMISSILTSTVYSNRPNWMGGLQPI